MKYNSSMIQKRINLKPRGFTDYDYEVMRKCEKTLKIIKPKKLPKEPDGSNMMS
jgi:hypothetical protein